MKIDNGIYDPKVLDYQDRQQAQVAALRHFYPNKEKCGSHRLIRVVDSLGELELPLEKSRIYAPYTNDVLRWVMQCPFVRIMNDADGREFIEY